ncbi:WXG100 family type VII secretion target [Streptantibioticus silvisoli]|uniref:WXG100 family type VII secretion target n=1 Tax=Streptantibioticus silvisoli TaxID=2705255 RepID=A0ABT6VZ33_9ACTN|nr:hypothetical protein [Streptantibioticus silvisoli]MDI5963747.1 hypothetical protein [Streptantibioticus silvisoli]
MADGTFSVNTEGLHRQLPYVENLAERFRGIGTSLQGRLGELGECWGDDTTGEQFFGQYEAPREQMFQGIGDSADVLDSTAQGIDTMARNYERLEDENVTAVRSLAPRSAPQESGGGEKSGKP